MNQDWTALIGAVGSESRLFAYMLCKIKCAVDDSSRQFFLISGGERVKLVRQ